MTAEERAQMLDMVDTHISIYSSGIYIDSVSNYSRGLQIFLLMNQFVRTTTDLQESQIKNTKYWPVYAKTKMKKFNNFDFVELR